MNFDILNFWIIPAIFLLGLRHGIDWDHIAAISNLSGESEEPKKSLKAGFSYILGHATVVILLGFIAVLIGLVLPTWLDNFMRPLVGLTLIVLGMWLIISLFRKEKFVLRSRWMLLFDLLSRVNHYFNKRLHYSHSHKHLEKHSHLSLRTAYFIGAIHGIGAETPTQMLLFLGAGGVSDKALGSLLILVFVLGLIISNSVISFFSVFGFSNITRNEKVASSIGLASALFSLTLGVLFLFNFNDFLS